MLAERGNMKQEKWLPVSGYEGLYEVSDTGRIRSLFRYKKELKPCHSTNGYLYVQLFKGKKGKNHFIHRLVANAFIENPDGKPFVNHKDETRTNNCVDNLEWVTNVENCRYGTAIERRVRHTDYSSRCIDHTNQIKAVSKPIDQYDKSGSFIRRWNSASECSRATGMSVSGIRRVVNGNRNSIFGYVFKEVETCALA